MSWGNASEILAAAGVTELPVLYRQFTSEKEKAALTVPMRLLAAVIAKNPDAFADVFAENGSLVQYDDELRDREEIRAYVKAAFEGPFKYCTVTGRFLFADFLTDDVLMLTERTAVILPGERSPAPERVFHAMWVIRKRAEGQQHHDLLSFHQGPIKG
jgi:uncharacterized protein (TIGR02246 family)